MIIENYEVINWNEFKKTSAIIESCETEPQIRVASDICEQFLTNINTRAETTWNFTINSWKHPIKTYKSYYRQLGQMEAMKNELVARLQRKYNQVAPNNEDKRVELKGLDIFA